MKKILLALLLISISCALFITSKKDVSAYPSVFPTGVTINKPEAYQGYTTFAINGPEGKSSTVYIIDMQGDVLHKWEFENAGTMHNYLLKNGHLVSNIRSREKCPVMGCLSAVEERDWEGNVVWRYENDRLHHPAEVMPDGSIVAIYWDVLPQALNSQVKGGIPNTEGAENKIITDVIRIVNHDKEVVWEWYPHKQLNIADWPLSPPETRQYWPNINRVKYLSEDNPFNGRESLLVSFRKIDTLAIIDIETKKIVWKWGEKDISHQHDPHLLNNGNILVFDNGYHRAEPDKKKFSRILEINPRINKIIWEYDGSGENLMRGFGFYSFIGGFVERLPNWNSLITETTTGRIFEVNQEGEIVWEYVHPVAGVDSVFRFSPDEVDWSERLPPPAGNKWRIKVGDYLPYAGWLVALVSLFVFKLKGTKVKK